MSKNHKNLCKGNKIGNKHNTYIEDATNLINTLKRDLNTQKIFFGRIVRLKGFREHRVKIINTDGNLIKMYYRGSSSLQYFTIKTANTIKTRLLINKLFTKKE